MNVIVSDETSFEITVSVAIIGAGACGLCAALAATDAGADTLVIERDRVPRGSTGLSTGLIPASGSKLQKAAGVEDSNEAFIRAIHDKTDGKIDPELVERVVKNSAETVDWLCEHHGINLELCRELKYPGHDVDRMHGTVNRSGAELQDQLLNAAERNGVQILTDAEAVDLFASSDRRIIGVAVRRPDGKLESIGCDTLILCSSGFGANPELVSHYIPELANAPYLGHEGNTGNAIVWGLALGAATADMSSFQGHGAIGNPSGVPMWNTITINGIQVNLDGIRFSDESAGYSEQAMKVLAQPEGLAWNIYDRSGHELASTYADYREGLKMNAIKSAQTVAELSAITGLPREPLEQTLGEVSEMTKGLRKCPYRRDFTKCPPLEPPYYAARVTGAFLHTQGGLVVSPLDARVLDSSGNRLPNLFAGGGAARGISGDCDSGYLAGNGLMTAVVLGKIAGNAAAALAKV